MTNNNTNPIPTFATHAERLAYFSNADANRLAAPIMPATVKRLPPRPRRHSVKHRAIR